MVRLLIYMESVGYDGFSLDFGGKNGKSFSKWDF
jgi:hypothetical protein